ncbi:MAG: glycosyltransferase, partial [Thiohalocapsa sp.]
PLAVAPFLSGGPRRIRRDLSAALARPARALLTAGILVPLLLFGSVALISDVEANWSALYLACAAPVAAVVLRPVARWALVAAATNLLLVSLYAFHAATALLPLPTSTDRIMRETHGYAALADHAASLPGPVFADRYPFAAMLNFYRPELAAPQWPGITRPSEYGRGRIAPIPSLEAVRRSGFWLVAYKFSPPEIPGFTAIATQSLFDCKGQPLQVLSGGVGWDAAACEAPYHAWRIYHYVAAAD